MLGIDTFLLEGPFEDFLVHVEPVPTTQTPEQRNLAFRALSQLRFDVAIGELRAIETAQRLLAALSSGRRFQPRVIGASPNDQTFKRTLLGQLEDDFLLERIVVESRSATALGERVPQVRARLPPLPRPAPEPTTLSYEVRFVDEVGQSVSGVSTAFVADGPDTVPTNAAGVALLDNVKSPSASVAIVDADALSKVLDPRWQRARSGTPPAESNTQEVVFDGSPLGPFALKGGVRNTVVITPPTGKLFVELWDKTGRVRHANQTFQIKGPQAFEGTTDDDGRLLVEDVFPGDYTLTLALEFFEENDPDRAVDIVESPLVVLDEETGTPEVREIAAAPFSVLAQLHMFFNTNKTFLLPTALPNVKKLRQLYADNAPCELLVVGHADTRGTTAYNDKLSLERAEATIAYLKDDVEGWFKFYGDGIDTQKRWGKVEDHLMIMSMSDFVDKPKGENEVSWFQRTRKLTVDGKAGSDTRHALIKEYMSLDGTSLSDFVGEIKATAHGCGENFPLDDTGEALDPSPADEKRDPIDRRVELFFFDNEFGITPPPPGPNSKPKSIEYPLRRKRVAQVVELRADDAVGPKVTFVELADAHFRTDSAVVLPEGENPDQTGQHQALTSVGLIATVLRLNEEQPGRSLLVAGHTDTTAGDAHNDDLSRDRARVALALLTGDRDTFASVANSRNKPADINQILSWVSEAFTDLAFNCDPGKISDVVNVTAVRAFQRDFNTNKAALGSTASDLTVDGSVGELTWGAFFDCYELALQQELGEDATGLADLRSKLQFVDDARRSLGYGERFPIEELGVDNFRSQTNRRVEVLFFNTGEEPDLSHDENDPDTSEVYLPGHFARQPVPPRKTARVTSINMVVGSFQAFVIDQAPFTIETDTGAKVTGVTDARGTITAKVPDDSTQFSLTVQDPRPIPEFQALFKGTYRIDTIAPATTPLGAIQRLRRIGLWDGPELAVFSQGTLDVLSYFQLLAGLPRSGQLDAATSAALEQVTTDSGVAE